MGGRDGGRGCREEMVGYRGGGGAGSSCGQGPNPGYRMEPEPQQLSTPTPFYSIVKCFLSMLHGRGWGGRRIPS